MKRRDLLSGFAAGLGALLVGRLPDGGLRLGTEPLAVLTEQVNELRHRDGYDGAAGVLVPAQWLAGRLVGLLQDTPETSSLHRRLATLTADATDLAGWVSFETRAHDDAMSWYELAASAAETIGDHDRLVLAAEAQARTVALGLGRHGEGLERLDAIRLDRASPTARAYVEIQRGRALARARQEQRSLRAIARAKAAIATGAADVGGLSWLDEWGIARQHGYALVELGHGDRAQKVLTEVLRQQPAHLRRGAGTVHQWLARSTILTGEPERAAKHVVEAHKAFVRTRSTRQLAELGAVVVDLKARYGDAAAVRELDEQLRTDTRYVTTRSMHNRRKVHQRTCPSLNRGQTSNAVAWRAGDGLEPDEVVAIVTSRPAEARPRLDVCRTCILGR